MNSATVPFIRMLRLLLVAGLCMISVGSLRAGLLFNTNSTWRFLRGTNEASLPDITAWRATAFDDFAFEDAPAPFHYGEALTGGTLLGDMANRYPCIFLRRQFIITNAAQISALRLGVIVEDGLVAWINGTEVLRLNMPGAPGSTVTTNTLSTGQLEPLPALAPYDLPAPGGYLINGINTLAIQAFNSSLASSDFALDAWLRTYLPDTTPPAIAAVSPPPGDVTTLGTITVTFTEPVENLSAADLLIGGVRAFNLTGGGTTWTFGFAPPPYGPLQITWAASQAITDEALPPNPFNAAAPGATWQYNYLDNIPPLITTANPAPGATLRALNQIQIDFSEPVENLLATDLLINGTPATALTASTPTRYTFTIAPPPPGPVAISWAAVGHLITDTAGNPFNPATPGHTWQYTIDPNAPLPAIRINEIMAGNQSGLLDEDGEPQDWIELHNHGTTPVNLANWTLTDTATQPDLWILPNRILNPGGYLIIYASGKDRRPAGGTGTGTTGTNRLHTNFKLGLPGEHLGLYTPDHPRQLASGYTPAYPEQRNDISYGPGSSGQQRYFATPTPGAANGTSTIDGLCEPVHFSTSRGYYNAPLTLHLTCATPGAQIRYTTDGTEPGPATGQPYLAPLRLTNTTMLRAAAFRTGAGTPATTQLLPSLTATHTYFFNLTPAQRSLPILSIVTAQSNLTGRTGIIGMGGGGRAGDNLYITNNPATDYHNPSMHGLAWERPVSLELIAPGGGDGFQIDCGLRVQGSDYQRPRLLPTSKFSFRTYFRSDYGPGRLEHPLFPLTTVRSFDQLVLRAGFNEQGNPFVRDELSRRLSHDMGNVASHGTVMNLFTNGGFAGYYNPCERVHEEMLQAHLGGSEDWDVVSPTFASSSSGFGIVDGDRLDFQNLVNYVNTQNVTNPAVYQQISTRLDLPNYVDYLLLNVYSAMGDWPQNNFRAGRDRAGGPWRFIVWDAEWGFNFNNRGSTRDTFSESGPGPDNSGLATASSEIAQMYQRLRASPEFRLLWADRIQKHLYNRGALTDANITNRFNELRQQMLGHFSMTDFVSAYNPARRAALLPLLNTYGLYGISNATHGLYASSNAPVLNQHGGPAAPGFQLSMTAPLPGSAIHYTTDGTDPRVPFTGATAPTALTYTAPLTLNQSFRLKARSLHNGTNWSALTETDFSVAFLGIPLRLTELNYNPPNPAHEFLEIQNIGGSPVDLSGMTFEGITYTFLQGASLAPGARLVLATDLNPAEFATRYPGVNVFAYYTGNLNNGGERLALKDRNGNYVFTLDYDDAGGWPVAADGTGATLENMDPNGDADDPANWRASTVAGGTPGAANTPAPTPQILLSEIMAENGLAVNHSGTWPDWVELHNPGGAPVNLAGWSLTDDASARKYVLPAGTQLPALGYLVIWCDDATNTTPGLHSGFALSRGGDNVYLYNAATNLVDAFTFGLQLTNRTIARFGGSWQLGMPTPGAANSAAALAPASSLSINEWQASAPAGQSDWIELHNTAADPVALRGLYLSNTSAVHRIVSHSFIAPFGFAQMFADEAVGPDHLDFRLPAAGGAIVLSDATSVEINRVIYTNAVEGLARGRFPDGSTTVVNFPGSASPGASNYVNTYTGPVLNELLARNQTVATAAGTGVDFVELFNPGAAPFSMVGLSLSVDAAEPGQWYFPAGTTVPAGGYLTVWCDGSRAASTAPGDFNIGRSLDAQSGGAYLFNAAGQLVNSIEYGPQLADMAVGVAGGQWRLLESPTPGAANAGAAALGTNRVLRINEWMADPADGADWLELHNPTNLPVDLGGLLLTDDPSVSGLGQFRIAPLSFIGAGGFVQFIADGDAGQGRHHLSFSLDAEGEFIGLLAPVQVTNFVFIDAVAFAAQARGVSEGRLPDGGSAVVPFQGSASPGGSNFKELGTRNAERGTGAGGIVISEVLSRAASGPGGNGVELFNSGPAAVDIGGWFLAYELGARNAERGTGNFSPLTSTLSLLPSSMYRIPNGTVVPPGGFAVLSEGQFGGVFSLNGVRGGVVWLAEGDAGGNLTGWRTGAVFGPSAGGVSFGRVVSSAGVEYLALLGAPSLGGVNSDARVGPVVVSEIMYHPAEVPPFSGEDEFVELWNLSGAGVSLFDAGFPTNGWRLAGGVGFEFPAGAALPAGGFGLVVPFDPANSVLLGEFRSKYGVAPSVPVWGPFAGRLGNGGDVVVLERPDVPVASGPDAGWVPYIVVDGVVYGDVAPWPAGLVDGGGWSLQRRDAPLRSLYGSEGLNWSGGPPSAGAGNVAGVAGPVVSVSPQDVSVLEGEAVALAVAASGAGPLGYQWRRNGVALPEGTNGVLSLAFAVPEVEGSYDCLVSNPGGAALSGAARVSVRVPAQVLVPPANVTNRLGSNVVFSVLARGTAPLSFQWRRNGLGLPGETNASLLRTNIQMADDAVFDVVVSNPVSTTMASARCVVLSNTVITLPPVSVTVVTGAWFTVSVAASGNPLPFGFEWRQGPFIVASNTVGSPVHFATFRATNAVMSQQWRVVVRNLANSGLTANQTFFVTTVADGDGDGIPDAWEDQFSFNSGSGADRDLDADGDGLSNFEEYVAGTDPTDYLSGLRASISRAEGLARVSFPALSNRTYSVEFREVLGAGSWLRLGDVLMRTNNRVESVTDAAPATNVLRVYRVVTPQQP